MEQNDFSHLIQDKVVLVTGATGTVGSEVVRQALEYRPTKLVCLGRDEVRLTRLRTAQQEWNEHTSIVIAAGDVLRHEHLEKVFAEHRPNLVFHTAAHKHAQSESDAIEVAGHNIVGTANVVALAERWNIGKLLFTSTVKAIQPTSFMGVTKRVGEMLVGRAARRSGKRFITVRLTNIRDSRGSVFELFHRQIATGGPVTITHPEIERIFISAPEAVQFMFTALVLGQGGEIFAFQGGESLRIADLAREIIATHTSENYGHVQIDYIGLRPGEALIEAVALDGPEWEPTAHEQIFSVSTPNLDQSFDSELQSLMAAIGRRESQILLEILARVVPEFTPTAGEKRR